MPRYIVDLEKKIYKVLIECKNCKYYRHAYNDWDVCELYDKSRLENDYCSKAKRKEKNELFR